MLKSELKKTVNETEDAVILHHGAHNMTMYPQVLITKTLSKVLE